MHDYKLPCIFFWPRERPVQKLNLGAILKYVCGKNGKHVQETKNSFAVSVGRANWTSGSMVLTSLKWFVPNDCGRGQRERSYLIGWYLKELYKPHQVFVRGVKVEMGSQKGRFCHGGQMPLILRSTSDRLMLFHMAQWTTWWQVMLVWMNSEQLFRAEVEKVEIRDEIIKAHV